MNCTDKATLSSIAYCQGADALIHIGELETYSGYEIAEDLWIRFEDMAVRHICCHTHTRSGSS